MITIVAKSTIKPGMTEDFKREAIPLIEASQKESGCISYDMYEDVNNPNILAFIEQWEDRAAIDAHNKSAHVTRIVPRISAFREGAPEVHLYQMV